ncbi:MAG: hypothetical protein J6112_10385 [Clostridia bacterium]|nr:hypothetical protein [Clostridia bacterium]
MATMRNELYEYEITPAVFLTGRQITLSLRAVNERRTLEAGHEYNVLINESSRAEDSRFIGSGCTRALKVTAGDDHVLRITAVFEREGMYQIHVFYRESEGFLGEFRVYALGDDMKGLYPYRGDFHMHSSRSDGNEDPFLVVSNYRETGYDFTIISDHGKYYPSLEARAKFKIAKNDESPITDMQVLTGEEIHLPLNDLHYISCGSAFSVNALVTPNSNQAYMGDDPRGRSADGNCPPTMTREAFMEMITERAKYVDRPIESERLSFAAAEWIYEKVREGGGLGIFVHPYWMCSTVQVSEEYFDYLYGKKPFDAFEVLGGENYFQQNGFQTIFYYEHKAKGMDYPIVGSTDSHGSTDRNRNSRICSTIVFARQNKTEDIKDAVKKGYSVAIDTISPEYRVVGDFRLAKYGSFLMENWYPLHDRLCGPQGTYMREYVLGNPSAEDILKSLKGQVPALMSRFFEL